MYFLLNIFNLSIKMVIYIIMSIHEYNPCLKILNDDIDENILN